MLLDVLIITRNNVINDVIYNFPKDERLRLSSDKERKGKFSVFVKPTTGHRVCSEHFVDGTKTYLKNVPTICFDGKRVTTTVTTTTTTTTITITKPEGI